jgi:hypothetical protein
MDMANDKGCLRCTVDMSFASCLMSAELRCSAMLQHVHPDDAVA